MINRTIAPVIYPIKHISFPEPKEFIVGDNYPVYAFKIPSFDGVHVDFVLNNGYSEAPFYLDGLYAYKLLLKGTADKSAQNISDELNQLGAYMDVKPNHTHTTLSVSCLAENLRAVLHTFFNAIANANYPNKEIELTKEKAITSFKIKQKETDYHANKAMKTLMFGDSLLGKSAELKDYENVSRENILDFGNKNITLNGGFMVCSYGEDSTLEELKTIMQAFEGGAKPNNNRIPFTAAPIKHETIHVPGAVQDTIDMRKFIMDNKHEDYYKFLFVNTLFGGYFGSRLMKNIREEKGLTYGIYSQVKNVNHNYVMDIGADVKGGSYTQCFEEIEKEMKSLQTIEVSDLELQTVKNYLLGALHGQTNSYGDFNKYFINRKLNGIGPNFLKKRIKSIHEISKKDVLEISNTYFNFDTLYKVVATGEK